MSDDNAGNSRSDEPDPGRDRWFGYVDESRIDDDPEAAHLVEVNGEAEPRQRYGVGPDRRGAGWPAT